MHTAPSNMPSHERGCSLSKKNIASLLFAKAQMDLNTVSELLSKSDLRLIGHEIIGFHLQQTVEKATKALLTQNNVNYEFKHNLKNLFGLVEAKIAAIPQCFGPLLKLTPYATTLRYTTMVPQDLFDCESVYGLVVEYMEWIEGSM